MNDPVNFIDPYGLKICVNPHQKGSVEYWIYEWVGNSDSWEDALATARKEKMAPGPDADNRTAAEHYIFARYMRDSGGAAGTLHAATGALWAGWYFSAKYVGLWDAASGKKTSPASTIQKDWGDRAWWDSFPDNLDKTIPINPGDDCGC